MRKKMEWTWEQLDSTTWRAKTIGGWLVLHAKTYSISGGKSSSMSQSESLQFVSDRDHEWTIVEPLEEAPTQTVKSSDFAPK